MWCQSSQSGFVSVLIYKRLSPWWHSMCLERLELSTLKSVVWYSIQLSYKHSLLFTPLLITPLILTPLILTWHLTDLTKGQDTPWLTNLRFVYDTSFQDVKGFKATGSVRITSNTPFGSVKSDVRSTFSDLYTKGNVKSDLSFLICYCCLHLSRCNAKTQFFCITLTLHLTLSLISLWEIKNSLTSNTDLTSHTPWLTNLGFVYDTSDTPCGFSSQGLTNRRFVSQGVKGCKGKEGHREC